MGNSTEPTAEDFLREHGEESDFSFRSLFESSIFVSLDAMKERESEDYDKEEFDD